MLSDTANAYIAGRWFSRTLDSLTGLSAGIHCDHLQSKHLLCHHGGAIMEAGAGGTGGGLTTQEEEHMAVSCSNMRLSPPYDLNIWCSGFSNSNARYKKG